MAMRATNPQSIAVNRKGGAAPRRVDAGGGITNANATAVATYVGEVIIPDSGDWKRREFQAGVRTMQTRVVAFSFLDNPTVQTFDLKIEDELTVPEGTLVVMEILSFRRSVQVTGFIRA